MKVSISRRCEYNRRHSQSDAAPPMSMHAVSLLLEAIFLKAKSCQGLGRFAGIPSISISLPLPVYLPSIYVVLVIFQIVLYIFGLMSL
jgi:hypothetical protein